MTKKSKKVVQLFVIPIILLSLCAKKSSAESCNQNLEECVDRLEFVKNRYDKALDIIDNNTKLIRELQNSKKKNVLFPYGGFRWIPEIILPQIGIGYIRNIKRIGFKSKFFYIGVGGMVDVSFNNDGVHSVGCSFMLAFLF